MLILLIPALENGASITDFGLPIYEGDFGNRYLWKKAGTEKTCSKEEYKTNEYGRVKLFSATEWFNGIEAAAYGLLNLKPRELEQMQPQEIETMFEGYKVSTDRKNAVAAYFAYWLVAPHVKKNSVTPEKILKPLQDRKKKSRQELLDEKEYFTKLAQKGG